MYYRSHLKNSIRRTSICICRNMLTINEILLMNNLEKLISVRACHKTFNTFVHKDVKHMINIVCTSTLILVVLLLLPVLYQGRQSGGRVVGDRSPT